MPSSRECAIFVDDLVPSLLAIALSRTHHGCLIAGVQSRSVANFMPFKGAQFEVKWAKRSISVLPNGKQRIFGKRM